MSELEKREEISRYYSMTTEELQEILRKHAHGELELEPDTEELFKIMEVLSERRQQQDPQAFRSNEEAFVEFCQYYMPRDEKRVRSRAIRFPGRVLKPVAAVLIAVLVLVTGMTVTAEALHFDIWGKIANWTKEIFQFSDVQPTEPEKKINLELKSLQDALDNWEISMNLAPTWMPEGYVSKDLSVMDTPRERSIYAIYEKEDERLIISIRQAIGSQADQVEKNDDLVEVYVADGVDYYIFSNTETMQAAWSIGEFECLIIGKFSIEEMKAMIDSI